MLVDENAASVNYRYDEDDAYIYAYQQPQHTTWTDVEILKALDCYQYQSCEHPAWRDSQAHAFCRALEGRLIQALPGYDDAPWAISRLDTPAAKRRPAREPH